MRGTPFYVDPALGLNTRDNLLSMEAQYSPNCMNVIAGQDGGLRKRDCCPSIATAFTGSGNNVLQTLHASNLLGYMITSANTKLYSVDTVGGVVDITGGAVVGINCDFAIADGAISGGQGPVYIMPSTPVATTPLQWTGPAAPNVAPWTASAGTLFQGDYMLYFKNRMIMAGSRIGTNGSGVIASKVGDPRAWDTSLTGSSDAWLTNIDPNDGESITGLGIVGPYLLVFKPRKTYLVYDLDTGANRPISNSIGCKSWKSIANTPYGTVFVATDGHVYITDGTKIDKISDVVGPNTSLPVPGQTAGQPFADVFTVVGVFYNDHYYVNNFADQSVYSLDYNFQTKTWWRNSNVFNAATIWTGGILFKSRLMTSVVVPTAVFPAPAIQAMYEPGIADGFIKDGAAIFPAFVQSVPLAPAYSRRKGFQDYTLRRRYHALRGYVSGTVDLKTYLNRTTPVVTNASFAGASNLAPFTVYSLGVGYSLTTFWDSNNANTWSVTPWTIYTQPRTD